MASPPPLPPYPGPPPPGYPYPPPGYLPPYSGPPPMMPLLPAKPPKDDTGKILLLVALVVLLVPIILAAVLYVMVTGIIANPDNGGPPTIALAADPWSGGNVTLTVIARNAAAGVPPGALSYSVSAATGTVFFNGPAGQGPPVSGVTTTVTYQDTDSPGAVSAGDRIRISVDPSNSTALRGALFRVLQSGAVAGSIQLP